VTIPVTALSSNEGMLENGSKQWEDAYTYSYESILLYFSVNSDVGGFTV
jgi:hypothetical protein